MLKIDTVLCRAGTMDNYAYILTDEKSGVSAVLDPSEAAPIIRRCRELGVKPLYILNTHHHYDHTDGNLALKKEFNAKVVGAGTDAARIPGLDISVEDGDEFAVGESKAQIIDVSGHTQGHILWYFPESKAVFTGDTLFNLCVGGLFEGTPAQMWTSLNKIRQLPDDTLFFPGHEYTVHGAGFAKYLNPHNRELESYLQRAQERLNHGQPAGPVTLGVEKKCNPYLKAQNLQEFTDLYNS